MQINKINNLLELFYYQYEKQNRNDIFLETLKEPKKRYSWEDIFQNVINEGKTIFWIGGSLSYLVYGVVVWGFTKAPIPMVSALRESSIVFAIFIGFFFLNEKISLAKIISITLSAVRLID